MFVPCFFMHLEFCVCSMFCCALLCVFSSFAIILFRRKEMVALLCLLAHRIRIIDISFWDRKSYLTNVIIRRLSREGCTLVVLGLTRHYRELTSLVCQNDVIISSCISAPSAFFGSVFKLKIVVFNGEQEKESTTRVMKGQKNLSLLTPFVITRPCDAKRCSPGMICLSKPHTHYIFL